MASSLTDAMQQPMGTAKMLMYLRSYAAAKTAVDTARPGDQPLDHPMVDMVFEITKELIAEKDG